MKRNLFLTRLREQILLLDSPEGRLIQSNWLKTGQLPEVLNLEKPDLIFNIHRESIKAGADIIGANTSAANRYQLARFRLEKKIRLINLQGVEIARKASNGRTLIAAEIGPIGEYLEPVGTLTFRQALDIFREQVVALCEGKPDLMLVKNISELREFRAALIACREIFHGPLIARMLFNGDGRTKTGTDVITSLVIARALGVDVGGAACYQPDNGLNLVKTMLTANLLPLSIAFESAEAGVPATNEKPFSPEQMGELAVQFVEAGVSLIGGGSGMTAEDMKEIALRINHRKPSRHLARPRASLATRCRAIFITPASPTIFIGDRINTRRCPEILLAIKKNQFEPILQAARKQVKLGTQILEINLTGQGINEADAVAKCISVIQHKTDVVFCLNSANPEVLKTGLETIAGKAFINAVTGGEKRLCAILPLAAKYGAATIVSPACEKDVQKSFKKWAKQIARILSVAHDFGIEKTDICIDCTGDFHQANPVQLKEVLKRLVYVRQRLRLKTTVGINQILPERRSNSLLVSTFLTMALSLGLDLPLLNPYQAVNRQTIAAFNLLMKQNQRNRSALFDTTIANSG